MTTYASPRLLTKEQRRQMAVKMGLPKGYFDNFPKIPAPKVFDKRKG